jgi:hypothetical protein
MQRYLVFQSERGDTSKRTRPRAGRPCHKFSGATPPTEMSCDLEANSDKLVTAG